MGFLIKYDTFTPLVNAAKALLNMSERIDGHGAHTFTHTHSQKKRKLNKQCLARVFPFKSSQAMHPRVQFAVTFEAQSSPTGARGLAEKSPV